MSFCPIAIVGRACVLPGALTPSSLWDLVLAGRVVTSAAPAERWGIRSGLMLSHDKHDTSDKAISNVGGYVAGFEEAFVPHGFHLPAEFVQSLDPLFQWLFHTGREALQASQYRRSLDRVGAVVGNLSYPSQALSQFAERIWLEGQRDPRTGLQAPSSGLLKELGVSHIDPHNRFMSGLPAHFLAQALGLGAGAFALDAACASSLYAIKYACDALSDGRADLMLAGAVNRADDLFIHAGFTALGAMSPSGRTRPFHAQADGLVPAEGAALVALARLDDALADGLPILGVIRGIGLSNDGRGRGLLVPTQTGQVRALRAAYNAAGIDPSWISYVECHATGTTVGDAVEIATLGEVFGEASQPLAIGSLKANMGHLITAAGAAGLLKVLSAFEAGIRPATPSLDEPSSALDHTSLRALNAPEPWPDLHGPRIAAVSAFGFGGNNAHVIVQEPPSPGRPVSIAVPASFRAAAPGPVAVVAMGARVADGQNVADFAEALFTGNSRVTQGAARAYEVALSMQGLRFPPKDLEETLPQQLMVLAAAREAMAKVNDLRSASTGVFVGMQCDAEIARHGARWRAAEWAERLHAPEGWLSATRDGFVPLLGAAGVLGAMPNVVANRLSSQLDLQGPSFTLAAEELSGVRALQLAQRALAAGEIDAALVGAVDLCAEPVHLAAAKVLSPKRQVGGDAAVVLVLKRLQDARGANDEILFVVDAFANEDASPADSLRWGDEAQAVSLQALFGHAHAANGLLHVAAAGLCCAYGLRPGPAHAFSGRVKTPTPPLPWPAEGNRHAEVFITALGEQSARVHVAAAQPTSVAAPTASEMPSWLAQLRASCERLQTPVLAFAAHRAAPHMPQLLAAPAPTATTTPVAVAMKAPPQVMPMAPTLPSATSSLLATAHTTHGGHSQPAPPMAGVASPPPVVETQLPGFAQHFAYRRHLSQMHQGFVATQAALHTRFLHLRQAGLSLLLKGPTPLQAATTLPEPPPPVAPQATPAAPAVSKASLPQDPKGPSFSRADLEVHASGPISQIFGPAFADQDQHAIVVRMPEPPLLLADRVVGLQAEAGSMGLGTVWTETDVRPDSWFLNRGYMPAGIMIEAGQADLFLISYLGVDAFNRGQRAYRLLGCELTYHGSLPKPGDTLRYAISIDAHARQGDVRLFFFHYDCIVGDRKALTVRQGQAGFFSKQELDDSAGVLWSPEDQDITPQPRLDRPAVPCTTQNFSPEQVRAFAAGDSYTCFGKGFELAQTHTRSPAIQTGRMLLVDEIAALDPQGGPWKRGYLKAITAISPTDWFFQGHFKNDPCMPGTLMFEGCLQAMAFYLAAMGYTLSRDGWRFEPVPEESYKLQCRGQVLPGSKQLVCELFVEEVHDGPYPTLYADLLGTVDGLKAFHARRVGLRLVPDWPLTSIAAPPTPTPQTSPPEIGGFHFDYASLLACAWGRPSDAFGPMYRVFDDTRRVARLPGPPYHFMSRVTRIDGELGACKPGATIEIEYDVPPQAWYFDESGQKVMPFCVLLEAVLQPCGWLASFVGSALLSDEDLCFRNLDGTGRVCAEVFPSSGSLRTRTTITGVSRSGGMILQTFDVKCFMGQTLVYDLQTGFGFFPKAALENQVGLPTPEAQRALFAAPSEFSVDLISRPARYCQGHLRMPRPMLLMLDRITAYDPAGGHAGLGFARAEKAVNPAEWFFKAHFFQDPVQPGSLGIEAMLQLLQFVMLHKGLHEGMRAPRFEAVALNHEMTWKYRGQVVPRNHTITTTLEVTSRSQDDRGQLVIAEASLWVDGKRIYHASNLGMRIVDDAPPAAESEDIPAQNALRKLEAVEVLPQVRAFWRHHLGTLPPPVDQIFSILVSRFVANIHIAGETTERTMANAPRGVLFLANHQTSIESTLFAIVASAFVNAPVLTLAKPETQQHWIELLMRHSFSYPGLKRPQMAQVFDNNHADTLPGIIAEMAQQMRDNRRSVMVYVEGTRALSCADPVRTLSGTFIDMALSVDCPIVPVRLVGGLPRAPLQERTDFPVGLGQQAIYLGTPLLANELRGMNYGERRTHVLRAINDLGPSADHEQPFAPDPDLQAQAQAWSHSTGASFGHAVIYRLLEQMPEPCEALQLLLKAGRGEIVELPDTPESRWLAELGKRLLGTSHTLRVPHGTP